MTLIEVYLARQVVLVPGTGKCLRMGGAKSHGPNKERRHLIIKGIMHELLSPRRDPKATLSLRNKTFHCKNASRMIHLKLLVYDPILEVHIFCFDITAFRSSNRIATAHLTELLANKYAQLLVAHTIPHHVKPKCRRGSERKPFVVCICEPWISHQYIVRTPQRTDGV